MIGAVWTIQWGNPHTDPPAGQPRIMVERFYPVGHAHARVCPPDMEAMRPIGSGYSVYWSPVTNPPRQLPQDTLAIVRQKRLRRRMEKKYPLFAQYMIEEEMKKKPAFYAGITDEKLQKAHDAAIELQRQRVVRLIKEYEERERGQATR